MQSAKKQDEGLASIRNLQISAFKYVQHIAKEHALVSANSLCMNSLLTHGTSVFRYHP